MLRRPAAKLAAERGDGVVAGAQLDQIAASGQAGQHGFKFGSLAALSAEFAHQLLEVGVGVRQARDVGKHCPVGDHGDVNVSARTASTCGRQHKGTDHSHQGDQDRKNLQNLPEPSVSGQVQQQRHHVPDPRQQGGEAGDGDQGTQEAQPDGPRVARLASMSTVYSGRCGAASGVRQARDVGKHGRPAIMWMSARHGVALCVADAA